MLYISELKWEELHWKGFYEQQEALEILKSYYLFTQTCTTSSVCQACAWNGERRHCPQETGKLTSSSNCPAMGKDRAAALRQWWPDWPRGGRHSGVLVGRGLRKACEETLELDLHILSRGHNTPSKQLRMNRGPQRQIPWGSWRPFQGVCELETVLVVIIILKHITTKN